jgi:haloacetate dehalogenase
MTTIIEVELDDGKVLRGRADFGKGSPANPMTDAELDEKFRQCAAWGGVDAGRAAAGARPRVALEDVPDVTELTRLLQKMVSTPFSGLQEADIEGAGARIHLRYGGKGPPLLLLHGNPLTHVSWHKIAPRLAEHFTVVATDLRGYGDSSKPPAARRASATRSARWPRTSSPSCARSASSASSSAATTAAGACAIAWRSTTRIAVRGSLPRHRAHPSHAEQHQKGWAVDSYHWFFMAQPPTTPRR